MGDFNDYIWAYLMTFAGFIVLLVILWFLQPNENKPLEKYCKKRSRPISEQDTDIENALQSPAYEAESTAPQEQYTVMIVDDSAVVRAKLEKLMNTAGFLVLTANDGVDALAKLEHQHVDILITDLEMPNLDGFGLIDHVQNDMHLEHIPIVAITGHDELSARVHSCQGLFGIYQKPWNDRQLLSRMQCLKEVRRNSMLQHSESISNP